MAILRVTLSAVLLFAANQVLAAAVAAKKDGVEVLSEASNKGKVLQTLKKDEAVESSDREGMYWKVKTADGKDGFVKFTQVKRMPGSASKLGAAIQAAAKDSRDMDDLKSARSRSAVMGIRGLDESAETSFAGNVQPNLRMVYNMEDREVSLKRVNRLGDLVQAEVEQKMRKQQN